MRTEEIRFLLNGECRSVANPPATRSVLNYLREDLRLTGTKEGCAEGDCGACTVVVAEADAKGGLACKSVNACIQFLPTLDGKALFTVESLKRADTLHPVQQAMADLHASQCGFCTPGIVMSLFALYKTNAQPDRAAIEDALSGNLCRCTGYRPIVDAALAMHTLGEAIPAANRDWINSGAGRESTDASRESAGVSRESAGANRASPCSTATEATLVEALASLQRHAALETASVGDRFHAPVTLEQLAVLRSRLPQARLLAGGTDVGLWVTKQLREIPELIYVGRIAELRSIAVTATDIDIGAAATLGEAMPLLVAHFPQLATVLRRFASPPIRNAATLGGNIANGSPIGDSMPCLIALGARLRLRSVAGTREMALEDFYLDYQKTALRADEFLERILIPLPVADAAFRAYKLAKRFDQDISLVLGAFCVRIENGVMRDCRIAYGGMAATPKRAAACEAALEGRPWNAAVIEAAAEQLARDFTPIDDMRGSARYRMLAAKNLLQKFYLEAAGAAAPTRVEQLSGEAP